MLHLLVAYDIIDDRRRNKLAKFLKGFLGRVQKSVFEGSIKEKRYSTLEAGLKKIIDQEEDSIRIYQLCGRCRFSVSVIGTGVLVKEGEEDIIF